jgi:hypothetical protein
MYWTTTLVWHGAQCAIATLVCIIPLFAVNVPEFRYASAIVLIIILIILYIPINLLFCYVTSFAFKEPETIGNVQGWGVSLVSLITVYSQGHTIKMDLEWTCRYLL